MKKLLDFTPCNLADIPSKKGNRRTALMKSIRDFYEGEHTAVEVDHKDSYKNTASAVNALSVATKAEGLCPRGTAWRPRFSCAEVCEN